MTYVLRIMTWIMYIFAISGIRIMYEVFHLTVFL